MASATLTSSLSSLLRVERCSQEDLDMLIASSFTECTRLVAHLDSDTLGSMATTLRYFRWLEGSNMTLHMPSSTTTTSSSSTRPITCRSDVLWLMEAMLVVQKESAEWYAPRAPHRTITTDAFPLLRVTNEWRFADMPILGFSSYELLTTLELMTWRLHDWRAKRTTTWFDQFHGLLHHLQRRAYVLCTHVLSPEEISEPHRASSSSSHPNGTTTAATTTTTTTPGAPPPRPTDDEAITTTTTRKWAWLHDDEGEHDDDDVRDDDDEPTSSSLWFNDGGDAHDVETDHDDACAVSSNFTHECRMYMEHLEREVHASRWLRLFPHRMTRELCAATQRACDWLLAQVRVLDYDTLLSGFQAYLSRRYCSPTDEHIATLRYPTLRGKNPSRTMMMKNARMMLDARGGPPEFRRAEDFARGGPRSILFIDFALDLWSRQALGGSTSIEDALSLTVWRERPPLRPTVSFAVFRSPMHDRWVLIDVPSTSRQRGDDYHWSRHDGDSSSSLPPPPLRAAHSLVELVVFLMHTKRFESIDVHASTGERLTLPLNLHDLRRVVVPRTDVSSSMY